MPRGDRPGSGAATTGASRSPAIQVIEATASDPVAAEVYTDILAPSFRADELIAAAALADGLAAGRYTLAVVLEDGAAVAAAVVETFPEADAALLLYLAARPGRRGAGFGGALLSWVRDDWLPRSGTHALLAEIEHPAAHPGSPGTGDPLARLRFYAQRGGRAVDLPYFQPALRPGTSRVYGLILAVLAHPTEQADTIPAQPVRRFLLRNLQRSEGRLGRDPDVQAMVDRLAGAERVALLPLTDPARLPLSAPAGH
jgi:GNAT superfamily N-acetyltransferase